MAGVIIAGKQIISSAKFASAKNLTNSSPVNNIEDLALWLETTQSKSFDSAVNVRDPQNKSIAIWKDINPQIGLGTGLDVSQTISGQIPILKADSINGLPAIYFDGSNDYLSTNTSNGIPASNFMQDNRFLHCFLWLNIKFSVMGI